MIKASANKVVLEEEVVLKEVRKWINQCNRMLKYSINFVQFIQRQLLLFETKEKLKLSL
jgi:hypothetical protein